MPSGNLVSGARAPLPAEEIRVYLEQKLRELERTDSALSGRSVSNINKFTEVLARSDFRN